jgi:hypothetical protein
METERSISPPFKPFCQWRGERGDDAVEAQAGAPVCLGDNRCGGCLELAEAGFVVRDDRRAEVTDGRSLALQIVGHPFESLQGTKQLGPAEPR